MSVEGGSNGSRNALDTDPTEDIKTTELLVMTMDIDGQEVQLAVYEDDDPNQLATVFCEQYGLGDEFVTMIESHIYNNMAEVLQNSRLSAATGKEGDDNILEPGMADTPMNV